MRLMYEFDVSNEEEVETPIKSKNEAGEEITTHKKEKKLVTYRYGIKKPNRSLREAASIFNAVQINNLIRLGVLTQSQLQRRIDDDGGTVSQNQNMALQVVSDELVAVNQNIKRVTDELKKEKTDAKQKELDEYNAELDRIKNNLANFYINQMALYQNTAEVMARNKTLVYYICFLALKRSGADWVDMFTGTYDDRADASDELLEAGSEVDKKALGKFTNLIGTWFTSGLATEADWAQADKEYETGLIKQTDSVTPEVTPEVK